jgi:hypothetical protein
LSEEGCINSRAGLQAEKYKKPEKSFDGNALLACSTHRALQKKKGGVEEMTRFTDIKTALLAALIVLTCALSVRDEDRIGEAEPVLTNSPKVETRVLTG